MQSRTSSSTLRWPVRHPWVLLLVVGVVAFTIWAVGTRQVAHQVRAVFAEAPSVYSGEDVQVNGLDVGKITNVDEQDGHAVLGVGIQDLKYWPLHQGTTVALRFGTTVGNGTRYLQLDPGPASAPAIPENGLIGPAQTTDSVEFDQVFNIFGSRTRTDFAQSMDRVGGVVAGRAPQLGAGIDRTGPALGSLSDFTQNLSADQQDLEGVVLNGAQVTRTLTGHQAQITDLVANAAGTFGAFAAHTQGIDASLRQLPATLTQVRTTMGRLDTSLGHLGTFVDAVRPGASALGRLSANLLPAMSDLRRTIPVADGTFDAGTRAAPAVTRLLTEARPFSSTATPAFRGIAPIFACLRPYAPEIAALMSTWTSFTNLYDSQGHLARLEGNAGPSSFTSTPATPEQFVQATGQGYALIRPPGYNAGQSRFDSSCGITPAGLNPADAPKDNGVNEEHNN